MNLTLSRQALHQLVQSVLKNGLLHSQGRSFELGDGMSCSTNRADRGSTSVAYDSSCIANPQADDSRIAATSWVDAVHCAASLQATYLQVRGDHLVRRCSRTRPIAALGLHLDAVEYLLGQLGQLGHPLLTD
jgi:hypothetical protein